MEALNQIQSWLNAGNLDKVIQGCQEILEIEPGNTRALSMLKQAETLRHEKELAAAEEKPSTEAQPVPEAKPETDPLSNLEVEKPVEPPKPEPEVKPEPKADPYPSYRPPQASKKKMFLAMVIPAVVVVVIGGMIVMAINNANLSETLDHDRPIVSDEDNDHSDRPETDLSYLEENEQRVTDLTEMADAIDEYWFDNGHYPSISEIDDLIEDELGELPIDPRQGDEDASGDPYGYIYAVYNVTGEGAGTYILSALFQDSKGEAHPWAQGASTKHYEDYRKVKNINVTYIGD